MTTDLETPEDEQTDDSTVIRELREKAKRADTAEAEAQAARRELTLHKAGLGELSDKQMKALQAAHEGDWEPESLKATATELGFVKQPGEPSEPQIPADEMAAHQRVAAAQTGEPPAPPENLTAAIMDAKDPEEIKTLLRNAGKLAEGD